LPLLPLLLFFLPVEEFFSPSAARNGAFVHADRPALFSVARGSLFFPFSLPQPTPFGELVVFNMDPLPVLEPKSGHEGGFKP